MKSGFCLVCGQEGREGLAVLSFFVCRACEEKIVRANIYDPEYDILRNKLKKIWSGQAAAG